MAGSLDDDVPDDTTAAGVAPATSGADEEDRTVQQLPDPPKPPARTAAAPARAAQVAVPSAAKPAPAPAANVTSKRMTMTGLAPPAPTPAAPIPVITNGPVTVRNAPTSSSGVAKGFGSSTRPEPKGVPLKPSSSAAKPVAKKSEAEEEDASVTATAPAPRIPPSTPAIPVAPKPLISPLSVPMGVQIREMPPPQTMKVVPALPPPIEEEPADETEVRTVIAAPATNPAPGAVAAAAAAARTPPRPATQASPAAPKPGPPKLPVVDDGEVQDDELEDSVTTQAPAQVIGTLPEEDEPKTSPPMRMPPPIPAAGRSPFDQPPIPSKANAAKADDDEDDTYNAEESVTTRGPAVTDFQLADDDDSRVTADAPVHEIGPESSGRWPAPDLGKPQIGKRPATMSQALGLPPALDDRTEGTTNRLRAGAPPRPGRPESLASTLASAGPGNVMSEAQLQNGLRVINRGPPVLNTSGASTLDDPDGDDDQDTNNRTAVMIGAPIPPNTPRAARAALVMGSGQASAAAQATARRPDPSSDSGLRVHEPSQPLPLPQNDYNSPGAMMSGALNHQHGAATDRGSGVREYQSQPMMPNAARTMPGPFPQSEQMLALNMTIPANSPQYMNPHMGQPMPQMQQYDFASTIKKPRYGILVGLVGLLSFAIPLVLFLWLRQSSSEPYARTPNEVSTDHVTLAPPDVSTKAAPAASSSATTPKPIPPRPGPRRR